MTVDIDSLKQAQKLFLVDFPDAALQRLAEGFPAVAAGMEALRRVKLPIDRQPGFSFDPRMPGRSYPPQENKVVLHKGEAGPLPAADVDIAFASAIELSHWIRTKQITSARLVEIYLDRIARYDAKLNAYITVTAGQARAEAKARDEELARGQSRGPLHGVPYALKDLFDTAGIPTTWGAKLYKDRVPQEDATIVVKLREAGAVLLGKVATAELAFGASWYGGEVHNPWNLEEPSGGSSAGSGASVAAALCGFAIGTDSLGSILNPSDRCGIAGLRATYGRVPSKGGMPLAPTLDRIGPMCRRIEDAALILAAINGYDPTSANAIDMGFSYDGNIDLKTLKVGYSPSWFKTGDFRLFGIPPQPIAESQSLDFARRAFDRLGVEMVPVELDDLPYMALMNILFVEAAAIFEELTLSGQDEALTVGLWPDVWRRARFISAVEFYQTERLRRGVMMMMDRIFEKVDVVFSPTYGGVQLLMLTNFTGHPGLTIRSGFTQSPSRDLFLSPYDANGPRHRITANFCMHGRLFEDGKMIALARALEEEFAVWRERPPLFNA